MFEAFWLFLYYRGMNYLLVVLGGGLGALLRYVCVRVIPPAAGGLLPLGTVFVNCAGAFLIGFLSGFFDAFPSGERLRLFAVTGFLGGYTTFSAYAWETAASCMRGNIFLAFLGVAATNGVGIGCVFLGIWLGRLVYAK
ncbi:MAG: CrcB family protein [Spirochaetales bacterium]|nr:CrcB family protein [Spirochaetales bacterium]